MSRLKAWLALRWCALFHFRHWSLQRRRRALFVKVECPFCGVEWEPPTEPKAQQCEGPPKRPLHSRQD